MSNLKSLWYRKHAERLYTATALIKEPGVSLITAKGEQLDELGKKLGHIRQYQANKTRSGYTSQPDEHYREYLIEQARLRLVEMTNDWDRYATVEKLDTLAYVLGTKREQLTSLDVSHPESNGGLHSRLCGIIVSWHAKKAFRNLPTL